MQTGAGVTLCGGRGPLTSLSAHSGIRGATCMSAFVTAHSLEKDCTTACWYSVTIKTSIAGSDTWHRTWLVELSVAHSTRAPVLFSASCRCVYMNLTKECLSHMNTSTVSGVNWPLFSVCRTCFTFLVSFCFVLTILIFPDIKWLISDTDTWPPFFSLPLSQEKQDPSSTSLQLRNEIQVGWDIMFPSCIKVKCGYCVSFTCQSSSFCPQESLGFSSEVSTPETDRKYVGFFFFLTIFRFYHSNMWPEPVWKHEMNARIEMCVCCMSKQCVMQSSSGSHQTVHACTCNHGSHMVFLSVRSKRWRGGKWKCTHLCMQLMWLMDLLCDSLHKRSPAECT